VPPLFHNKIYFYKALQVIFIWMLSTMANAKITSGFHEVIVNGIKQPGFAFLVFDDNDYAFMALRDFMDLHFVVSPPTVMRDGVELVPLFGQKGLTATLDPVDLVLKLDVAPEWYASTRVNLNIPHPGKPVAAPPGALLNYDLQATQTHYKDYISDNNTIGNDHVTVSSSQDLAVFGSQGFLQILTTLTSIGDTNQEFSRLATTYLHDNEEQLTTLSVGDGVVEPSTGVPGVRYGGISWQTNFDLDPTFSTLETPTIFDEARLPSTLEFFLNDRRVGTPLPVQPGSFEISGLPTVDSSGQVNVVIRDALNNERIVVIPYIHSARLYREGLHGFSYTVGELRPELERYENPFVATAQRWGLTRQVTLGLGAAASAERQSLGTTATFLLPGQVIGDVGVALSNSEAGTGQQMSTSAQWQSGAASAGASVTHSSENFRLLGDEINTVGIPRDELQLFAARSIGNVGSVSATWGRRSIWSGDTQTVTSIGWSKSFQVFILSLNALHSDDGTTGSTTLMLTISVPLQSLGFASSSIQKSGHDLSMRADYASPPVTNTGVAYRVGMLSDLPIGGDKQPTYYGAMDGRSSVGEHGVYIEDEPQQETWRAYTAGSVGVLAGRTFVAPPITGGFALVTTGDAPDITLYRWNLPVAVSDSHGQAIVTTLSPYQDNLLAVRPEEVPFEYRITNTELTAVPRGRGGVLVEFNMVREQPALLTLQLPNGQPVPVSAVVKIMETGETALVGLRGEAYLENIPEQVEVEVSDQQNHCHFFIKHPPTTDPQLRLGPYVCDLQASP
jgi:outer membrane usher protein